MYRGILTVLFFVSLCSAPSLAQRTRGTVAFVDYEQVFTNYYKTKLANDQLKQMHASHVEVRAASLEELNTFLAEYKVLRDQSIDDTIEEEERNAARRNAEKKLAEVRILEARITKQDEINREKVDEQRQRVRLRYGKEIKDKSRGYAKSKGYTAIFDYTFVSESSTPGVLYYDEEADITAEIIKEINK